MSSWGNRDASSNAPYWAVSTVSTGVNKAAAAPTAANVAFLYANTTANVYTVGETIGLFAVDNAEAANNQNKGVAHAGWVIKTEGQGGRAGRTQYETLVALTNVTLDGDSVTIANTANP